MQTRTYTERSNARRAARAAGIDPDLVFSTEDGFAFPPPNGNDVDPALSADLRKAEASDSDSETSPVDDDIPAFCRISPEERKLAWDRNPPKAAPIMEPANMARTTKRKSTKAKDVRTSGADKTATLLSMLAKGATVEALCKATAWLPHTLRARICGAAKPKSKGGEGIKVARERVDGVTTYRIAS